MTRHESVLLIRLFALWGLASLSASAMWMAPDGTVPLDRLVENTKRHLSEHPDDASAYALLGRVYSLAFALDVDEFSYYAGGNAGELPDLIDREYQARPDRSWNRPGHLPPEKQRLLMDSIRNYQRAVQLAPENFLYWLGLGYMYHEGSREVGSLVWPFPDVQFDEVSLAGVKRAWFEKALDAYQKSFENYRRVDPDDKFVTDPGVEYPVALEIVGGIVSLLEEQESLGRAQRKTLEKFKKVQGEMQGKQGGLAITPIIFSLDGVKSLLQLLENDRAVNFDLAGDGIPRQWPWVTPGTAILVWDPLLTGSIQSGRQLIGSVTWWLFWEDGYKVLATLDDDGDGWLSGEELGGLAVWVDADGDAVSDSTEVSSIEGAGIQAIAVTASGKTEKSPFNDAGLRMRDGRVLPTYDWTTEPLPPATGRGNE